MGERITLSEIAKMARVSKATASYVLSGRDREYRISPDTAKRIRDIAEQLGYVPNRSAALLKKEHNHLIALMAPHFSDFYAGLLRSIELKAEQRDFQTLFGSTFDDVEREKAYINSLIARRIDGIIILPVDVHAPHLKMLTKYKIPTILFRRRADSEAPFLFMTFNDYKVGHLATEHLLQQGCRRIAFLSAPIYTQGDYLKIIHQARVSGYREALKAQGSLIPDVSSLFLDRGVPEMDQRFLELVHKHQIDGLVSIADDVALHGKYVLSRQGIQIPEQVKMVGCNDSELAYFSTPGLSSIGLPKSELGADMVQSLFRMIDNRKQELNEILLDPYLVVRGSSGGG